MLSRIIALRERLAEAGLDAIIITHPANRRYLTGFVAEDHPPNESAGHVVISTERAILVTSPLEAERARQQAPDVEIFDKVRPLAKADAAVLTELGAQRVGFEEDAILFRDVITLERELGHAVTLVPVTEMVEDLRSLKAIEEIDQIERAIGITDRAFERVAPTIADGDTERDIADRIDRAMRDLGADGPAFPTIVASGPNSALPHHEPTNRRIAPGEPIVIDMGARLGGYCADLTRTVWVGEPNDTLRTLYPIVLKALEAAEANLRSGLSGPQADAIAREIISEDGYGNHFPHSLGHGLGVQVHERPTLSPRSEDTLATREVITIEPGIYLPGKGGVRIEDVAVVEEDGVRVLTRAPKKRIDETTTEAS